MVDSITHLRQGERNIRRTKTKFHAEGVADSENPDWCPVGEPDAGVVFLGIAICLFFFFFLG